MIEYYAQIRVVHVLAVVLSGTLFAARGAGVLAGAAWPMHSLVRYSSYAIDTILLTAALMLATMLPGAMFANHWLTLKLGLLVVYVVLGSIALKHGRTPRVRMVAFVAALVAYAAMIGIARAHHPLGWFRSLAS